MCAQHTAKMQTIEWEHMLQDLENSTQQKPQMHYMHALHSLANILHRTTRLQFVCFINLTAKCKLKREISKNERMYRCTRTSGCFQLQSESPSR